MKINKCICDFCGKEIKNGSRIFNKKIKYFFGEVGFYSNIKKEYDCCSECHKKIIEFASSLKESEKE